MPTTVYNSNRTEARLEDSDLLPPAYRDGFTVKGAGHALPNPQKQSCQAPLQQSRQCLTDLWLPSPKMKRA